MRGFNPRWEYSRRARNFRNADGPEFARIVEERDRELEEYLDQHDNRISSLETGGVARNATILSALRLSSNFDELKAKLLENEELKGA